MKLNPIKKRTKEEERPQMGMDLQFSRFSFLHKLLYQLKRSAWVLEQFSFWRSPILWLQIFVTTFTTIYGAIFIYQKRIDLPDKIPLLYFRQDVASRLINTDTVLIILAVNVALQIVSIFVSSRIYFKFKFLSHFLILCSIISNIFFNLALFKVLRLTLY